MQTPTLEEVPELCQASQQPALIAFRPLVHKLQSIGHSIGKRATANARPFLLNSSPKVEDFVWNPRINGFCKIFERGVSCIFVRSRKISAINAQVIIKCIEMFSKRRAEIAAGICWADKLQILCSLKLQYCRPQSKCGFLPLIVVLGLCHPSTNLVANGSAKPCFTLCPKPRMKVTGLDLCIQCDAGLKIFAGRGKVWRLEIAVNPSAKCQERGVFRNSRSKASGLE